MKKVFMLTLVFICILFNSFSIKTPAVQGNLIKEGIYNVSNLNLDLNKVYEIQNTSKDKDAFVLLFDDHDNILQFIKLMPDSSKQRLLPLKAQYRIIILGTTEVFIS
ncbi:hypothetical protein [Clostridium intestinale]|uniref:Uncharacterized protein n=1 Tax=Clostridium intestinale URNW TaxID=1294142 RepID=U2Q0H4_9CLOT|nr:hypothetical protein [Clostridium intestinale]ERK32270.1 hypothetical protein CINTURNW_0290 [Clostridium intestinale URNW]